MTIRRNVGTALSAATAVLALAVWALAGASAFASDDPEDLAKMPPGTVNARLAALEQYVLILHRENVRQTARADALQEEVEVLQQKLAHVVTGSDAITVTGANLYVVNGTGVTDGEPNGLGNIIIGYNERRLEEPDIGDAANLAAGISPETVAGIATENVRTGSHMLVVGKEHNYTAYGGIVAGSTNTTGGAFASVTGGRRNSATGEGASVSGGSDNAAAGLDASVCGGRSNLARGHAASISGGSDNSALGPLTSVSGGSRNTADSTWAWAGGGRHNVAGGEFSSVVGGGGDYPEEGNIAYGPFSSIGGGTRNRTAGVFSWVGGGVGSPAVGDYEAYSGDDRIPPLEAGNGAQQAQIDALRDDLVGTSATLGEHGVRLDGLEEAVAGFGDPAARLDALETRTSAIHRAGSTTIIQGPVRVPGNLRVERGNLQVVNGTGTTEGSPNGLGNVIIGYNELRVDDRDPYTDDTNERTGSHMLILGTGQNYTRGAGIVAGARNWSRGGFASVLGGFGNISDGRYSVIGAGLMNRSTGTAAWIGGGASNEATGDSASVSGGLRNVAGGDKTSILGGSRNATGSTFATVAGGYDNRATGQWASVSGGQANLAAGTYASVAGGSYNRGMAQSAAVAGGYHNDAWANYGAVGGGSHRSVWGPFDWAAGALYQDE